ncbi:MAG: molybdopterin molybdotransferase MoeA, partial [Verrucomicrobiales bacterium]|nr:molybdopterin molybdotransferase MoeA [Verrucomicrobiales bacterium]
MIEEIEARRKILDSTETGPVMWVPLSMSTGAFAGETIGARIDSPLFDNSAMDGYAVRASECRTGDTLRVAKAVQAAGPDVGHVVHPGEAVRIFTGAPVPPGADAVIMQEDVKFADERKTKIEVLEGVEEGEFIRRRGSDVCEGQRILGRGEKITPATVGLIASQGLPNVPIFQRPLVNILTTGDELVDPGEWLAEGEIYNSNGPMLAAAVERIGGIAARLHAPDDPEVLRTVIKKAFQTGNFLIVAGGVSVGERDFVKGVLNDLGAKPEFWRVNVKPGKPFLFGRFEDRVSIFGLPGNPVSAFVTFSLFA